VTVTLPPRPPAIEDERTVEERIAELEALIKEARRRARHRRAAYAAVVLVALGGIVAGASSIGNGGVGAEASVAQGSHASATNTSRAGEVAFAGRFSWISAIQVDPKRPHIVYASTLGNDSRQGGVVKSTDAGKTWGFADTGLTDPASPQGSTGLRVDALTLDPRSPNVLYAGTGRGVFKTTDGARTWKPASDGIDLPTGNHPLAEGSIYGLAIDPVHASTVYAAGRGVWKSTTGGATWKRVLRRYALALGIAPRQPETVYATSISGGNSMYRTVDGGDTWRAIGPSGLYDHQFVHPIVIDRRAPGIVYVGGSRGLFASKNQGRTWKKLLSREVGAIALDPSRANVLYVGAAGGVFKSDNGGHTWSALRLNGRGVSAIAIAPTRAQTIYAGVEWKTPPDKQTAAVFASRDGGGTWHRLF
jgi:photosystem II stability/assembly factor-like uncharacterized protein